MLRNYDVGVCVYMVGATPCLGWGGMITFFACGHMVDATHL